MFAKRTGWNLETNRLSEALAAHRAAGKPLIDLTISNPTECGFHYDETAILGALQNRESLKYQPNPRGLEVARQAVCQYYAARAAYDRIAAPTQGAMPGESSPESDARTLERCDTTDRRISIDDIFLTTSTSEAYSYAFRTLCDPEDEVLIPEPSYPLFDFLADVQDVRLVRYPLVYDYGWQIDFHGLEQAITPRTRAAIVVNPNNPTGSYCKAHEITRLNEICAARGMAIIADEVFLDFALTDSSPHEAPPTSFAGNQQALTFTLSGLSKICGLPQMKAAWAVVSGPAALKSQAAARLEVIADTYLSMNAPIQHALPVLLSLRHNFREQLRARARANLAELDRQLAGQQSRRRLAVEGGWNVVLQVPATHSDEDLALELLETKGVYVHPGHFYDFPSAGYLIVSLTTPASDFTEGIERCLSEC